MEKAKPKEGDIDVLLDPYGMNMDLTYVPDEGNKGNGITEYKETYKAAVWMKEELEQHGLRVEITKSDASEQPKPAYGKMADWQTAIRSMHAIIFICGLIRTRMRM